MQDTAVRLHRSGKVKSARGHVTNNLVVTLEVCGQSVCYWPTNGGNESLDAILPKQGNYDVHLCFSVAVFFLFFLEIISFLFFLFLNQQKLNIPREISSATRDFLGGDTSPPRPRVFSTIVIASSSFFVVVIPDVVLKLTELKAPTY